MKIRVLEVTNGYYGISDDKLESVSRNYYKIQVKYFLFWFDVKDLSFSSLEEADEYIKQHYIENTRVVREYKSKAEDLV